MSEEKGHRLNLLADNILKFLIAGLVGVLSLIGKGLQEDVSNMEKRLATMEISIAKVETVVGYLEKSKGGEK